MNKKFLLSAASLALVFAAAQPVLAGTKGEAIDKTIGIKAPVGVAPIEGGAYTFTLKSFKITNTRSLHEDTDFVSMAVAVGNNAPIVLPTKSMGDLNNGTFQVNLSIPNVVIGPTDKVAFSYAIVNTGYDANKVEQDLKKAVTAAVGKASSAAGDATISLVGSEAKTWLTKLENLVFPNCDGSVAAGEHVYTEAQLSKMVGNGRGVTTD